jgi:hypothetical protein
MYIDILNIIENYYNSLMHYDKFKFCLNDIKNIQYENNDVFSSRINNNDVVIYFINITHKYYMDNNDLKCHSSLKLKIFKNKEKKITLNY